MKSLSLLRTATVLVALGLSAIAFVAMSAVEPLFSRVAEAQDESGGTSAGVQAPPPVPGIEYSDGSGTAPEAASMAPATPAAPVIPSDAETIPDVPGGGSTTAILGGSDVAVASVGGSYQIDAPHKKKKRSAVPVP
jgi:hypothetical protein